MRDHCSGRRERARGLPAGRAPAAALLVLSLALVLFSGACGRRSSSERTSTGADDTVAAVSRGGDLARWLTPAARETLESGSLRPWYEAQRAFFPAFRFEEFHLETTARIHDHSLATTVGEQIGGNEARRRLLLPSPDGRWILDPFYGLELVEEEGHPADAWDADHGFRVFDGRSDSLVAYDVWGPGAAPWTGAWIGRDEFVIVGSRLAPEPTDGPIPGAARQNAAVWIGDMETREMRTFLGPAIPDAGWPQYLKLRAAALRARHPHVAWAL